MSWHSRARQTGRQNRDHHHQRHRGCRSTEEGVQSTWRDKAENGGWRSEQQEKVEYPGVVVWVTKMRWLAGLGTADFGRWWRSVARAMGQAQPGRGGWERKITTHKIVTPSLVPSRWQPIGDAASMLLQREPSHLCHHLRFVLAAFPSEEGSLSHRVSLFGALSLDKRQIIVETGTPVTVRD